MEGKILNHICHLTSLEELYLGWNHFSSIPAGISRLSNLKALDLSHCKNLQQIPELPSSLRFLDAHCSDSISSSPSLLPILSMVNCFKSEIEGRKVINRYSIFYGNGIGIVIPRSSGILEWITYRNMGRNKITIELPPNWYENDDLWGFALCCVYVTLAYKSPDEPDPISEDYIELMPRFYCNLTIEGNNQLELVGCFSFISRCVQSVLCDVSVMQWVICYPKLAIEKSYHTNQWTHFNASFYGALVEECGIRLVYREDYEQKHPTMAQGSTSHGNFGEHGSVREDTNSKAHNKRNPNRAQERSVTKRFRETQD
ncbi:disease resistance protein RPV1-like [Vitis riparia]|uniref:disease resistance protein RPV1-like n=1 Tax=Vitis riparia TaxID=96939 RepID=UPI00155A378C|nr:disease resistance protein RPV1-like [Vitis riparia]